jgi:hypothetical protein
MRARREFDGAEITREQRAERGTADDAALEEVASRDVEEISADRFHAAA